MGAPYRDPVREAPEPPQTGRSLFLSLLPGLVLIAIGLGARCTLRYPGSLLEQGVLVGIVAAVYVAVIRMHLQGQRMGRGRR